MPTLSSTRVFVVFEGRSTGSSETERRRFNVADASSMYVSESMAVMLLAQVRNTGESYWTDPNYDNFNNTNSCFHTFDTEAQTHWGLHI